MFFICPYQRQDSELYIFTVSWSCLCVGSFHWNLSCLSLHGWDLSKEHESYSFVHPCHAMSGFCDISISTVNRHLQDLSVNVKSVCETYTSEKSNIFIFTAMGIISMSEQSLRLVNFKRTSTSISGLQNLHLIPIPGFTCLGDVRCTSGRKQWEVSSNLSRRIWENELWGPSCRLSNFRIQWWDGMNIVWRKMRDETVCCWTPHWAIVQPYDGNL